MNKLFEEWLIYQSFSVLRKRYIEFTKNKYS